MGDPRSSLYATGRPIAGGTDPRAPRGLPCRYAPCRDVFTAAGMGGSIRVLREVAALRDAHEVEVHGGVFRSTAPAPARGRRKTLFNRSGW